MTIHRSLRLKNALVRARNVFTRIERLEKLEKDGRRTTEDSVFGLPKVRTRFKVAKRKAADAKPAEGGEAKPGA